MYSISALRSRREPAGDEETALVAAAQLDPSAFGELHARYEASVWRYLRSRTATEEDAADLTQQTFLQALDALPRYQERGLPFAAWLFRIARNVATDHHRRTRVAVSWDMLPEALHPSTEASNPEGHVLERERSLRLRSLLAGLPSEKRELIALHFVGGLTIREMAPVVGKSKAAVQKALHRTLVSLKEQYREE